MAAHLTDGEILQALATVYAGILTTQPMGVLTLQQMENLRGMAQNEVQDLIHRTQLIREKTNSIVYPPDIADLTDMLRERL